MSRLKLHIPFFFLAFFLCFSAMAQKQEVSVEFSEGEVKVGEKFSIKVSIRGEGSNVGAFPNIEGFTKGGRSVAHTNYKVGKQQGIQHTITQNYNATTIGVYKLSPFTLQVNDEPIAIEGRTLRILSDKSTELIPSISTETDVIPKEDASVILSADKTEAYVGEGISVSLAFYISELNTVGWDFPDDLTTQMDAIARKIKPENCLESRLLITNVAGESVVLNNKKYTKYKVFEAIYYPLNETKVKLPPVELTMWKKNPDNKRVGQKKFETKPLEITIKPLPDHPLKDRVAVGDFTLKEWLSKTKIETGNSFSYKFWIVGEGNFATINFETPPNDNAFDFFPSKVSNNLITGKKNGEKNFEYRVFPKIAGTYPWENYIEWVYFNTKKEQYDTLKSKLTLMVSGDKVVAAKSSVSDIYDNLENMDTSEGVTDYKVLIKNIANVLVIGMIISLLVIFQWKKNR